MSALQFSFINKPTEDFFYDARRNLCISGGFGSGKTIICCMKLIWLGIIFKNTRWLIGRQTFKTLRQTTYKSFMKFLPQELIESDNSTQGVLRLKNGTEFLWMHMDTASEETLRGLEINGAYLDQPEEISEEIYTVLDARIGRWDKGEPDMDYVEQLGLTVTKDEFGRWEIPQYFLLSPNPDVEWHWIWCHYHPESPVRQSERTHGYYNVTSLDNPMLTPENLQAMLSREKPWVERFVFGKWGASDLQIHRISPESRLAVPADWVATRVAKNPCYRTFDHGEAAPTVCTWWAVIRLQRKDQKPCHGYVCYREYYAANAVISVHRKAIAELSANELYVASYADPSIFKRATQKDGAFWTVALEYSTDQLDMPPIAFLPADNNELGTRNRINEFLWVDPEIMHPLTGEYGSPRIFFVTEIVGPNPAGYGVKNIIPETQQARRKKLGEVNGRPVTSDEREASVTDHAYDTLRYMIGTHGGPAKPAAFTPPANSFMAARNRIRAVKQVYGGHRLG